jgi:hypothetical protein
MSANQAPECSTLRRHWEAMQGGASSAPAAASSSTQSSGGGLFAWLKSLFS